MEFRIRTNGVNPNLTTINAALAALDPLAMADMDPADGTLRVAAELGSAEVLALLTQAGYPVTWRQLAEVPSVCCGACGG